MIYSRILPICILAVLVNTCATVPTEMLEERVRNLERKLDQVINSVQVQTKQKRLLQIVDQGKTQVAFDAHLSHAMANPNPSEIIKFDVITTNNGNVYDKNIGVFIAPVDGTYLFSWTTFADFTSYVLTSLMVNGNTIAEAFADSSESRLFISSATRNAIVNLSTGDRVYVQVVASRGSLFNVQNKHSGFCGTLLFQ